MVAHGPSEAITTAPEVIFPVGTQPADAAIDPKTNRIYVSNFGTNGTDGSLMVLNGYDGQVVETKTFSGDAPRSVVINKKTRTLYVALSVHVHVYSLDDLSKKIASVYTGGVASMAVNEATNQLFTVNRAGSESSVQIVDGKTNAVTGAIAFPSQILGIAVDEPKNLLYLTGQWSDSLYVADPATQKVTVGPIPVGGSANEVVVDVPRNRIYVGVYVYAHKPHGGIDKNKKSFVVTLDRSTYKTVGSPIDVGLEISAMALEPDEATLYVSNTTSNNVSVIDLSKATVADTLSVGGSPSSVTVSPSSEILYVTNSSSNNLSVFEAVCRPNSAVSVALPTGTRAPEAILIDGNTNDVYVGDRLGVNKITSANVATRLKLPSAIKNEPFDADDLVLNDVANELYLVNGKALYVYDIKTNAVTSTITTPYTSWQMVAHKATSTAYLANIYNGAITIVNVAAGTASQVSAYQGDPYALALNNQTNMLFVANNQSKTVSVISGSTGAVVKTLTLDYQPTIIAVDERTNKTYVANHLLAKIDVIDGTTYNKSSISLGPVVDRGVVRLAVDPLSDRLIAMEYTPDLNDPNHKERLMIIDTTGAKPVGLVSFGKPKQRYFGLNPNIDKVYVANPEDGTISVVDAISATVENTVTVGVNPKAVVVNPNTNKAYIANFGDDTVSVIKTCGAGRVTK